CISYSFFFFQAEDGIRDRNVTGVQTCALPILSCAAPPPADSVAAKLDSFKRELGILLKPDDGSAEQWYAVHKFERSNQGTCLSRSEERRVGKECRSRWSR